MNAFRLPSPGAASRAARAINDTMSEIAVGVRELREQADTSAPAGNPNPVAEPEAASGVAAVAPVVPSGPPAPEARPAAAVPASAAARAWPALPPVPDLRPELAAFTAALTQQNRATLQAFRQLTGLCQSQQQQMERMAREIETLASHSKDIRRNLHAFP